MKLTEFRRHLKKNTFVAILTSSILTVFAFVTDLFNEASFEKYLFYYISMIIVLWLAGSIGDAIHYRKKN